MRPFWARNRKKNFCSQVHLVVSLTIKSTTSKQFVCCSPHLRSVVLHVVVLVHLFADFAVAAGVAPAAVAARNTLVRAVDLDVILLDLAVVQGRVLGQLLLFLLILLLLKSNK